MWDLPQPGLELMSPAFAGGFFTTVPPGKFLDSFFFFPINLFIYLFLSVLGLQCRTQAFSSCGERGLLFITVHLILIAVASHCGARALGVQASVVVVRGLSSCGSQHLEHRLSSCGALA